MRAMCGHRQVKMSVLIISLLSFLCQYMTKCGKLMEENVCSNLADSCDIDSCFTDMKHNPLEHTQWVKLPNVVITSICDGKPFRWVHNSTFTSIYEDAIAMKPNMSISACQQFCSSNKECKAAVLREDNACELMLTNQTRPSKENATVLLYECCEEEKYQDDCVHPKVERLQQKCLSGYITWSIPVKGSLIDGPILAVKRKQNITSCQEFCHSTSGCNAVSLRENGDCLAMNSNISTSSSSEFVMLTSTCCPLGIAQTYMEENHTRTITENHKNEDGQTPLHIAVIERKKEIVECLLQTSKVLINVQDTQYGSTALHYAAQKNDVQILEVLLSKGANPRIPNKLEGGETPLHLASSQGHLTVVEKLLEISNELVHDKNKDGRTPLHAASFQGHLTVVEKLLEISNELVHDKDKDGRTPLHWASYWGHLTIVEKLLEISNELVHDKDKDGRTPLHWASSEGRLTVVEKLLQISNELVHDKTKDGATPLHLASRRGHLTIVEKLLEISNELVHDKTDSGQTPLHLASLWGRLTVVEVLLSKGANPRILNNEKQTPRDLATRKEIVDRLAQAERL